MELVFLRALALLFYAILPLPHAFALNSVFDMFDCPIEYLKTTITQRRLYPKEIRCDTGPTYQVIDKVFDLIFSTIAVILLQSYKWTNQNYTPLLTALFLFRLVGLVLYAVTQNRQMLFYFPNFFNYMFIYLVGSDYYNLPINCGVILILIIAKLVLEYRFHGRD